MGPTLEFEKPLQWHNITYPYFSCHSEDFLGFPSNPMINAVNRLWVLLHSTIRFVWLGQRQVIFLVGTIYGFIVYLFGKKTLQFFIKLFSSILCMFIYFVSNIIHVIHVYLFCIYSLPFILLFTLFIRVRSFIKFLQSSIQVVPISTCYF